VGELEDPAEEAKLRARARHRRAESTHREAADLHERAADFYTRRAQLDREAGQEDRAQMEERAEHERVLAAKQYSGADEEAEAAGSEAG
jgi:hypothetical protein